jgi:hypothetical protein
MVLVTIMRRFYRLPKLGGSRMGSQAGSSISAPPDETAQARMEAARLHCAASHRDALLEVATSLIHDSIASTADWRAHSSELRRAGR